tara:strand:+ start:1635 stop:3254 length:1620 start_codon:yes stop_codon:yes gene_type:complete
MSKNVWLYIGTASRTLMIPASKLRGMHPAADGTLLLSFNSIVNTINTPPDKVILNLFADNTHLDVIKAISRAIHNQTPTFGGFVTLADDTTTAFHQPEYLTDRDGTEAGKIASVNSLIIQDASSGALTATTAAAWANGTETPRAGVWTVTSDSAAKVVHLPPCHSGARVEYICSGSGFKLRAEVVGDFINGVNGEVEEVCPAGLARVKAYGMTASTWLIEKVSTAGEDLEISGITTTGEDIDLIANSASINLTATENAADAIVISASAGGIAIGATGEAGQNVDIVNTGGSINLQATESATDAITINATAGGVDISASGAAAGEDIDITATGSSVNITSTESDAAAIVLNASSGGIDITASGGGSPIDITSAGSINISAGSDGSGALTLDGPGGTSITNLMDPYSTLSTITDCAITAAYNTEYIINDASGGAMLLPAADKGKRIRLIIQTALASNMTITAQGGDLLKGYAIMERITENVENIKTVITPDGTDDLIITLDGGQSGGLAGDIIDFWGVSGTEWRVRAHLKVTGGVPTDPFS